MYLFILTWTPIYSNINIHKDFVTRIDRYLVKNLQHKFLGGFGIAIVLTINGLGIVMGKII